MAASRLHACPLPAASAPSCLVGLVVALLGGLPLVGLVVALLGCVTLDWVSWHPTRRCGRDASSQRRFFLGRLQLQGTQCVPLHLSPVHTACSPVKVVGLWNCTVHTKLATMAALRPSPAFTAQRPCRRLVAFPAGVRPCRGVAARAQSDGEGSPTGSQATQSKVRHAHGTNRPASCPRTSQACCVASGLEPTGVAVRATRANVPAGPPRRTTCSLLRRSSGSLDFGGSSKPLSHKTRTRSKYEQGLMRGSLCPGRRRQSACVCALCA